MRIREAKPLSYMVGYEMDVSKGVYPVNLILEIYHANMTIEDQLQYLDWLTEKLKEQIMDVSDNSIIESQPTSEAPMLSLDSLSFEDSEALVVYDEYEETYS